MHPSPAQVNRVSQRLLVGRVGNDPVTAFCLNEEIGLDRLTVIGPTDFSEQSLSLFQTCQPITYLLAICLNLSLIHI